MNDTLCSAAALCLLALGFLPACTPGTPAGAEPAGEAQRLFEVLHLEPGQRVADVGAGDGDWVPALAERVGPRGHVFATEVTDELVAEIRERVDEEELSNVTVLRGDDLDTGLPAECCDALLLRMVYHHFTDPAAMRASLRAALVPGGRIAVVDIQPQKGWRELEGVPDRGGHGIPLETLVEEMTADGFTVESRHTDWNGDDERFCVVFEKKVLAMKLPG